MGTITITVVGDASVGTKSKTYNLSDANINRLVAWTKTAFATTPTVAVPSPPVLTTAQALVAWADKFIARTKQDVLASEYNASINAVPAPTDISIS